MLFKNFKSNIITYLFLLVVLILLSILFIYNIRRIQSLFQKNNDLNKEGFGLLNENDKCKVNKAVDKDDYILKSYAADMCTCPVSLNYNPSEYVSRDKALNVIKKICSKNGQKFCSEIGKLLDHQ